jgi:methyl-accepting chemotaxis protein
VLKDLTVLRSDALVAMFGPGKERAPDALEKEAMASGKEILRVEHDDRHGSYLRVIRPVLASKNYLGKDCTTCHQANEGTPLGAVSMKISLDKVESAATGFLRTSVLIALLVSMPLLALLAFGIQRFPAQGAGRRTGLCGGGHASPGRWRLERGHRLARR